MRDNKVQFAVVREDPMVEAELIRLTNASNVVLDGDRVVAVAAAILRCVPPAICEKSKMVWYLCCPYAKTFSARPYVNRNKVRDRSLDAKRMRKVEPIYLAITLWERLLFVVEGKKDIILQSTGSAMPLLHVQFGPCAEQGQAEPLDDYVHMFCVSVDHPLLEALKHQAIYPSATATVVHHGMEKWDWRFILTSDI